MIPLRIFASRTAGVSYVSSFCLEFVLWATQYYLIQYVSLLHGSVSRVANMKPTVSYNPATLTRGSRCGNSTWNNRDSGHGCSRWNSHLQTTKISNRQPSFMATGNHRVFFGDSTQDWFQQSKTIWLSNYMGFWCRCRMSPHLLNKNNNDKRHRFFQEDNVQFKHVKPTKTCQW